LVLGLLSWQNSSLPFSNVGFSPEVLGASRKDKFIELHNPWEKVDSFYGLGSTVFSALLILILLCTLLYQSGKFRMIPKWVLVVFLVGVLTLAEMSRVGSSLVLSPAAVYAILILYPTKNKIRMFLIALSGVLLIPALKSSALMSIAVIRQAQAGIPWNLVPFDGPNFHRVLLGLSFSLDGYSQPGMGGVVWSDNAVVELVKGGKSLVPYSPEYSNEAAKIFLNIVQESPFDYLSQLITKFVFTSQFFEIRILLIILLALVAVLLKSGHKSPVEPMIFWVMTSTVFLGILPLLLSRPFSLFLFYLKPASDLILSLLIGIVIQRLALRIKEAPLIEKISYRRKFLKQGEDNGFDSERRKNLS
jgi:hypothetical protein